MTAKEWLDVMKQAADYNPAMTNLIEKYGEMLLEERKVANKNFVLADVSSSLLADLIKIRTLCEKLDLAYKKINPEATMMDFESGCYEMTKNIIARMEASNDC